MREAVTEPLLESPPDRDAVREELLRRIAEDARHGPESWLRDAEVPEGGE